MKGLADTISDEGMTNRMSSPNKGVPSLRCCRDYRRVMRSLFSCCCVSSLPVAAPVRYELNVLARYVVPVDRNANV